ncbi:peroxin 26 [Cordyceps militaris CM01]|uniref:Peroxin 26 n=1 Tax=Cordyceps militaris (strain CM01) TaxID=983644 RepID=G3J805_CORMM|nr:peroxin 26 [Cordyceps militaris CM01]EGX97216.1 peroxin 26 [Cordyceps militaris CM01]
MSFDSAYAASPSPTATAKSSDTFGRSLFSPAMSSSFSSPAAQRQTSHISKTYRQASTLFLTRRLPEALSTLLPLITPPAEGDGEPTPVSSASRTTRVKVWSLYLTTLNAIVEMEPEEGKAAFGTQEWRALCAKVRDGTVWEEIVRNGYHGSEGHVDSEVVINLLNGGRSPGPRMSGRYASPAKGTSGTDTPRDLTARVKILELYTLHVLLRNNEWDYAREFISVSAVLDDERREAFLQALQSLQEEHQEKEREEREERQRQEDQLRRDIAEARRLREAGEERERRRLEDEQQARKATSETDYGVESSPSSSPSPRRAAPRPSSSGSISSRPGAGRSGPGQTPTLTARASAVFTRLKTALEQIAQTLNSNPVIVLRLLGFLVSLLVMLGHKGLRQRLQRMLGASWAKVAATAGMGTKVSYI